MNPVWSLFWFTVRQTILARKVALAVMMLCGPSAIATIIRIFAPTDEGGAPTLWEQYHFLILHMMLGGVVPLVCMVYGPAIVCSEVEAGTIVYLFTRQMKRATVVLTRYVATAFAIILLIAAAMVVCHLVIVAGQPAGRIADEWRGGGPTGNLLHYLLLVPILVTAFLAIFATLNQITAKGLVASGVYFVVVEMALSNIPAKVRNYSVSHHMRKTVNTLMPEVREIFAAPRDSLPVLYPTAESGWLVLAGIAVVLAAFLALLVSRSELMPERAKRE